MSMIIDNNSNILRFDVPNSEACINAQHLGIIDRTVGSYYMSESYEICKDFLSNFDGEYFLDLSFSANNVEKIIETIETKYSENVYKDRLVPQKKAIEALRWYVSKNGNYYRTASPSVNENKKYLKLDNCDSVVELFRTIILGDLCSLNFKKIGSSGYIIYVDKNSNFQQIVNGNAISKWGD